MKKRPFSFQLPTIILLASTFAGPALRAQTIFNLNFDYAYFLPSDVAGSGFGTNETTPVSSLSGVNMEQMALWDIDEVSVSQRQAGEGDFNSVASDIDWNSEANPIDGNGTSTVPNYRGIEVKDFWKGIGIDVISNNVISILDSHDFVLNDGVAGDTGNIKNGAGGTGGDGDSDNLTGNDPDVVAQKANPSAPNNTAPNARNMGNLLINEENAGDAIPDDSASGDVKRFEIDDEASFVLDDNGDPFSVQARLDKFVFVDDVDATITIALKDPSNSADSENVILSSTEISAFSFSLTNDNEIFEVNVEDEIASHYLANTAAYTFDLRDADLDYWEIDYNSSGGLGEAQFTLLNTAPIPEPSGVLLFGGLLLASLGFHRRRSGK